jgi:hypothetical protein
VGAAAVSYYAARIFLTNTAILTEDGTIAARTLGLTISRSISGGLHEDLDITNNSMKPVKFQLEIAIRCDFADLFEVKSGNIVRRGRITTEWSQARQQLCTTYRNRDFSRSVTTDVYLRIARFIHEANPKRVGLCGLMFPCLEDFELAAEYEQGNFPIERNAFLSLHSGLGIDSYPIGVDERPERIVEVLTLVQGLSNKYMKPLSARFVSDGKANIGQLTHFGNPYLKDVVVRPL